VTIVKGISNLEGIDSISMLGGNLVVDLSGSQSVLVEAIAELDVADVPHLTTAD
jgi:hypothetical protein